MIWNQHLLYQIIDVWYHIRKLYLINNEKNDKIKLNHFFYKRRPIVLCYDTDDMILVCQALLITAAEHGFFCESLKLLCFLLDGGLFL